MSKEINVTSNRCLEKLTFLFHFLINSIKPEHLCNILYIKDVCFYHEASRAASSTPRCNIGLNLKVRGNGTLAEIDMTKHNTSCVARNIEHLLNSTKLSIQPFNILLFKGNNNLSKQNNLEKSLVYQISVSD